MMMGDDALLAAPAPALSAFCISFTFPTYSKKAFTCSPYLCGADKKDTISTRACEHTRVRCRTLTISILLLA